VRAAFADPVLDAQRAFRRVLDAMAHPGRIVRLDVAVDAPAPLGPASAAVCLTLLDLETPLWVDAAARAPEALEWLRFHCGVPLVEVPGAARFALVAEPAALPPLDTFDAGTDAMPDRSATLIVQVEALASGSGPRLYGPGIAAAARLDARGARPGVWNFVRANGARFPRGVDLILTAGADLAALPRTVRMEGD
jgi:alpha-D-ribose 1-methylphosphonate 5-triphosphate synthase subunit PhnH